MTQIKADVLFCDDIRQEVTGKFIFIGVYPSDLIPGTFPSTFSMSVFIRIYGVTPGTHEFKISLISPSGDIIFEKQDTAETSGLPISLVFTGFSVPVTSYGDLIANVSIAGAEIEAGRLIITPQVTND